MFNTVPSKPKSWCYFGRNIVEEGVICEAEFIVSKPDYDVISQRKENSSKDRERVL